MRSFLSDLIMPLPLLLLLAVVAIFFYFRKKWRWTMVFTVLTLLWFLLISTPLVPHMLVRSLENRYTALLQPPDSLQDNAIHIMVLGCGYANDFRLPWTQQLATQELGRLVEGLRLHSLISGSKLVLSASNVDDHLSQAETAARAALLLGADPADTLHLVSPTTTWEEALAYRERFLPDTVQSTGHAARLILVTDALHMPRAMMLFRKAGLHPIPAPANFIFKTGKNPDRPEWWPSSFNVGILGSALHEYAGMLWAK